MKNVRQSEPVLLPAPTVGRTSTSVGDPGNASHQTTRNRVAKIILEHGPQTAAALADELGLTPAAVRRHLDAMVAEGALTGKEQRVRGPRGRGRPAKVFVLTDAGRDAFYQAYDDVALSAIRYIRDTAGDQAVAEFARTLVSRLEVRYRSVAAAHRADEADLTGEAHLTDGDRAISEISVLAEALTEDGYAASVEPATLGEQLCQHHCPVAHVAEQFPQLCEAETEVFSRILGRHVQRLATIAHGDGVCTTHVPRSDVAQTISQKIHQAANKTSPDGQAPGKTDKTRVRRTAS